MFHGGGRPIDIYRRIYSGINGTPMPGFSQQLSGKPDTFWDLVHYVEFVSNARRTEMLATNRPVRDRHGPKARPDTEQSKTAEPAGDDRASEQQAEPAAPADTAPPTDASETPAAEPAADNP